jgi:hypothetical protein
MDPDTPVWQMYGLPQPMTSQQLIPPSEVSQQLMSGMGGQQQAPPVKEGPIQQSFKKGIQDWISGPSKDSSIKSQAVDSSAASGSSGSGGLMGVISHIIDLF